MFINSMKMQRNNRLAMRLLGLFAPLARKADNRFPSSGKPLASARAKDDNNEKRGRRLDDG